MIKSLNKGKPVIEVQCDGCGHTYESKYNRGQMKKFLKEFGEYENHTTEPCDVCGTIMIINMNIPREEMEEKFFDEVEMPENERESRRVIKNLMNDEFKFEEVE